MKLENDKNKVSRYSHTTMENDISNYFLNCGDCGYKCRSRDGSSTRCPDCAYHMSPMFNLNREQQELLMEAVALGQFTMSTEYELMVIIFGRLGRDQCERLMASGQFAVNTDDDLMFTIFTLLDMPLPKVPYAFFAQSCWHHIRLELATENTKVAMEYYEKRFVKSVANLADVDMK